MHKILVIGCLIILLLSPAVIFANGVQEAEEKTIVLKVGHGHTATHSYQGGMEEANKRLEEKTNGRITMQFFPSGQLGNERQMQEQLSAGTLEMTITGLVNLYDPAFALFDFPFLYDNREQIKAVMYSDLMDEMNQGLIGNGLRIIGLMEVGFRNVTSNTPITTPSDLKGFKIRTPESPAQIETFKALGANPTPMSFSELYTALQQGVVDGQENPLENIYNGRLYEVQDYVNVTRHIYNFAYVLISETTWQSLSSDDQNDITEAIRFGCDWQINFGKENEERYANLLKSEGMEFVNSDRDALREGSQAAYQSEFVKKLGSRGTDILNQIKKIVASVN